MIKWIGLVQKFEFASLSAKLNFMVILIGDFEKQVAWPVFDDPNNFNTSFVMYLKCWLVGFDDGLQK